MYIFVAKLKNIVAVVIAAALVTVVFAAAAKPKVALPIVMYHSVLADKSRMGDYVVTPEQFESDLNFLLDNGYQPVTVQMLIDFVYYDAPLPDKPVMITFDDGFYNNYYYIYPIIKEKKVPIVISLVGSYTELYTSTDEANYKYSYLRKKDIIEMENSGLVEFQNHSFDLHSLNKNASMKLKWESEEEYRVRLTKDLTLVQNMMVDTIHKKPSAFTYPFGKISNSSDKIIKDMGFLASLSCSEKMNYITKDPNCLYLLGRYNRPAKYTTDQFMKKLLSE